MKTILRTSLLISLILLLVGCSLPEVTPAATPSVETLPTSTAPVIPTLPTPTETPVSVEEVITAQNAAQLKATDRSANSNVQGLVWSRDSRSVLLVSQNSSNGSDQVFGVANLSVPSLAPQFVWAAPAGSQYMAASADGKTVAVISHDRTQVPLVESTSGKTLKTLEPGFAAMSASFSPDGKTLALAAQEAWKVNLYDTSNGQELQTLTGFETAAPVYNARFAGSNQWLVWFARGTLQLQNPVSGAMGKRFEHEDFISDFTLTADGALLASAAGKTVDGIYKPVVYLWDTASGNFLRSLVLDSAATALSFSPDGTLLAVAAGNIVQIWDVANEAVLATLTDNPNPIYLLAFSPDGRTLASSGNDNQLILWTVVKK